MRLEPNAVLALSTGCSLGMLIGSATIFGEPNLMLKYIIIAVVVTALYIPLNNWMRKRSGQAVRPLIHLESPVSPLWANIFPGVIALTAFIPVIWMGHDYGLLVLIATIWFAGTLSSAMAARKA